MSWFTAFFGWRRNRRQSRQLAFQAETANVVLQLLEQQHWQPWHLPVRCWNCNSLRPDGTYCCWCGMPVLPPQPDRHTSGYNLPALSAQPKRTQVLGPHMVAQMTDTHKLPALSPEMRHIIAQRQHIDEIVDKMRQGK